ncbi:MAG: 5-(carboxyamino)imidazole ribonucleotide synthase [Nitrosospira sp.]|nr:5-(carboxyamino)imidazole ribonucleotide synthase [Nitrosospira sp.]MDN5881462.1 5-(carboxyamino)imidazole ribonucleotide synthase [Nitrosospira sp.]MDN5935534.1 5-(carboxyamino)imidazole ribonucleotide synthase [Nitrosospira sp.]
MNIMPGAMLGLLGGGQLGRMFTMAAQSMGYRVTVLDPADEGPSSGIAERHLRADYLDGDALRELGAACAGVTTEFENVPAESLRILAEHCVVSPAASSVTVAQNRILEKQFLAANGFGVVPYAVIQNSRNSHKLDEVLLQTHPERLPDLFPAILKVSRFGYDGKGQVRVTNATELDSAFTGMNREPCVLEQLLQLESEVSVVVARGFDDKVAAFPVAENQHRHGILDISIIPARVSPAIIENAREIAIQIAEKLDHRGVLCVEFFVLPDGAPSKLLVNEIAPRPHNSGHYTIDACVTSQFEQQVRILCGVPLGSTAMRGAAVMVNLLGDLWQQGEPRWEQVLRHPSVKLHLYGKLAARPGRKMGHYTVLAETTEAALQLALEIKQSLAC